MNAIVLVVDHWHAGYLGCYGNSWIATPAVDRLASQSFLFDQALLESPRLEDFYRACWLGRSAHERLDAPHDVLPAILKQQQVHTALVSDEPGVLAQPPSQAWDRVISVPAADASPRAETEHDCQFARVFDAATDWLAEAREPFLLWTHFRGMGGPWDAPMELRARYFEDEELTTPEFVEPPRLQLEDNFDPDELLKLRWSYAAQVSLFDACLAEFLQAIDTPQLLPNTLLVLASPRGYPLGEHRLVGMAHDAASPLHAELIHVPWLLRMPGGEAAAMRSQALVQPGDLHPTLLAHFEQPHGSTSAGRNLLPLVRGETEAWRDHMLLSAGDAEQAIRTPAWYLRVASAGEGKTSRQLFVKPDDRWEVNEVADRCPDIADELQHVLAVEISQAAAGHFDVSEPLSQPLVEGLR
jgi:arylsulfatase A-like enzyme